MTMHLLWRKDGSADRPLFPWTPVRWPLWLTTASLQVLLVDLLPWLPTSWWAHGVGRAGGCAAHCTPSHPSFHPLPLLQILHFMDINDIYRKTTFIGDSQTSFGLQIKRVRSTHATTCPHVNHALPAHTPSTPLSPAADCPCECKPGGGALQQSGALQQRPASHRQWVTLPVRQWLMSQAHTTHTLFYLSLPPSGLCRE